ncbi:MAG: sigma-70 family RNA polymerase sigma factor [Planctomycetes bacterium]|nr:sigma-70 family RNA polymerase sigma factor [Planctomycetota bacterium]
MARDPRDDPRHWVQAASTGDAGAAHAIEALLERYLPDIRAYVARNAGELVRAKESASDLAQSVCREVLESLKSGRLTYRSEAEFKQWLYRAAVMKMMNRRRYYTADRRDARAEDRAIEPAELPHADSESRGATPSRVIAWREELAAFEDAFAQLPENYREVIALHHVEQLSHAEIAKRLEISEANSRMLLSRALARLARYVRPGGEA